MAEIIEALVEGGKATPGPPIGPALGPLGVNIGEIIKTINEKTADFAGMKVPVRIEIDPKTKAYEVTVGTPPVSALVLKELGIDKGAGARFEQTVGDLTLEQVVKIARMKSDSLLGGDMRAKAREIIGTCVSIGVTIEGRNPKAIIRAMDAGELDLPV
ncbi:MAG TPA: 50S ribosomal protein L11 [Thermoplasmata archaeon]|nr:50S ribosomal protein L11 [Thermoplasmata archaeon]